MQPTSIHMASTSSKLVAKEIGRRKTAVASVHLHTGEGESSVNGKPLGVYFSGAAAKIALTKPFLVTETEGKYWISVKVLGGGANSQQDAVVLGIAKALTKVKPSLKTSLRAAGLLTRDSRERQRRIVGTGGKARRQKQSPKR